MSHILAFDQGTTSSRAIVFDAQGAVAGMAQKEFRQIFPQPGWVEHDARDIWSSQMGVAQEAISAAGLRAADIVAIGLTNQRETTVIWERATGRPIHNAIVWQDRRTAGICEHWRAEGLADLVARRTGLVIDPYFSASKIRWLLDTVPGLPERARAGEIAFGTIDSFLLWRLTGGTVHATDVTNASRTMLYDIGRGQWDEGLCRTFGVPPSLLPRVADCAG